MSLKEYFINIKKIIRTYNNPLKRVENLKEKDRLEKEFYDEEAQKYLDNFDENLFKYIEDEPMPLSHSYFYSNLKDVSGKRILDICCGYGFTSVRLAKINAYVDSIDISPKMIALTKKNAQFNNVSDKINANVMSAQDIKFPDNTFDYVVGVGALHHLNLDLAGKEIFRVLKKGGRGFFIEARIPFKFFILLRSLFPHKCFESPGGSQLSDKEIKKFISFFGFGKINYFLFLKKLCRFKCLKRYEVKFDNFDLKFIKKFPFMKRFYWATVIECTK